MILGGQVKDGFNAPSKCKTKTEPRFLVAKKIHLCRETVVFYYFEDVNSMWALESL